MQKFKAVIWAALAAALLGLGGNTLAADRYVTMYLGTPGQTWANPGEYIPGILAFTGNGGVDTLTFVMPNAPDGTYLVTISAFGQSLIFNSASLEGQALAIQNLGDFYGSLQGQRSLFLYDSVIPNSSQFTATFDGVTPTVPGIIPGYTVYAHAQLVSAVPEPETYAMLLAGLAAFGFIAFRKQAQRRN